MRLGTHMTTLSTVLGLCLGLSLCLLLCMFFPQPGLAAEDVLTCTIDELIEGDDIADGAVVSFSGEAIGEPLDADDGYKWVNLEGVNDLLGVYMTDEQCAQITEWGSYGVQGSEVEIVGTYNLTCEQHRGDLDVHASDVTVTAAGGDIERAASPIKYYIGGILIATGIVLMLFYNHRRKTDL